MVPNRNRRHPELKYEFDRLTNQKMEQVFDILLSKVLLDYEKERKPELVGREKKR